MRYLTTFGFGNFGQGNLRHKKLDTPEQDLGSTIVPQKRKKASDGDQKLNYLTGFGFSSFGLKRAKMIEANHLGLRYLLGFGFSNIGQKRIRSTGFGFRNIGQKRIRPTTAKERMKQEYLTGFGFSNFGQKRNSLKKEKMETQPKIGNLLGFGFESMKQDQNILDGYEYKVKTNMKSVGQ